MLVTNRVLPYSVGPSFGSEWHDAVSIAISLPALTPESCTCYVSTAWFARAIRANVPGIISKCPEGLACMLSLGSVTWCQGVEWLMIIQLGGNLLFV